MCIPGEENGLALTEVVGVSGGSMPGAARIPPETSIQQLFVLSANWLLPLPRETREWQSGAKRLPRQEDDPGGSRSPKLGFLPLGSQAHAA